ncbi:hypothetical protein OQA88_4916 [Cercophora sp. LCS_1]
MRTVVSPLRRIVQSRPINTIISYPEQLVGRTTSLLLLKAFSNLALSRKPYGIATTQPTAVDFVSAPNVPPGTSEGSENSPAAQRPSSTRLKDYGKWRWLSLDEGRLRLESDFESPERCPRLLVDMPENANDFDLWLCVLDYRHQRDGVAGVAAVMEGLMSKACLYKQPQGKAAQAFWSAVLEVATRDRDLLENVLAYALWLDDNHSVRLPDLYFTIVSSLIREHRYSEALSWHLGLGPRFGFDIGDLKRLMMQFIASPDSWTRQCLKAIYVMSHHRRLYDDIIPYLYENGFSQIAAKSWRPLLIAHGDFPRSSASRPFLRFLRGYHRESLLAEEQLVAGLPDTPLEELASVEDRSQEPLSDSSRESGNMTHGQTFGVKGKRFNDEYGAKYFASSWLSVDFGISSLYALGIPAIGPLTLQSIALREQKKADRIASRIGELEAAGISIGDSSYAHALRHAATTRNQSMVTGLIKTDIHPDVFDDPRLEQAALRAASATGNWEQYRLITNVRLAVAMGNVDAVANDFFRMSLAAGNHRAVLRLLAIMNHMGVELAELTIDAISSHIPERSTSELNHDAEIANFYACLCSITLDHGLPPSSRALRTVLTMLCHSSRYNEFSRLAIDIIGCYSNQYRSTNKTIRVHKSDVPLVARDQSKGTRFQELPSDLSLRNSFHPLRLVFSPLIQDYLVWQAFRPEYLSSERKGDGGSGREDTMLHFTDGIRVLALLRDNGVKINLRRLRKNIVASLAIHERSLRFIPGDLARRLGRDMARKWNLRVAGNLCEGAWGRKLFQRNELESGVAAFSKRFLQQPEDDLETHQESQLHEKRSDANNSCE